MMGNLWTISYTVLYILSHFYYILWVLSYISVVLYCVEWILFRYAKLKQQQHANGEDGGDLAGMSTKDEGSDFYSTKMGSLSMKLKATSIDADDDEEKYWFDVICCSHQDLWVALYDINIIEICTLCCHLFRETIILRQALFII